MKIITVNVCFTKVAKAASMKVYFALEIERRSICKMSGKLNLTVKSVKKLAMITSTGDFGRKGPSQNLQVSSIDEIFSV